MNVKKTMTLLLIAALLAGIGAYFAFHYIQKTVQYQKQIQTHAQEPVEISTLVGVPSRIRQGTIISTEHIQAMEVPLSITINGDYIHWQDRNDILGQRLLASIPSGSGLQYSDLIDTAHILFSDQLKSGERAMTIAVDPLNSHFGFLQPKDHIDLLLVAHQKEPLTKHLLSNIEVLATDTLVETDLSQPQLPNSGKIHTLTLRLTLKEAQILALAKSQGQLTILLRNQTDVPLEKYAPQRKSQHNTIFTQKMLFPTTQPVEIIIGGSS